MRWLLIMSLLLLSVGCASAPTPTWTPERKALADHANAAGRAARGRAERNATEWCNVQCQMDREYAIWARSLPPRPTMLLPLPMNCLSLPMGTLTTFSCY